MKILILGPLEINQKALIKAINDLDPHLIIFVDGGYKHKAKIPKKYNASVSIGDGDSIAKKDIMKIDILLEKDKNFSDLQFALNAVGKLKAKIDEVLILGFTSKKFESRYDHLLFNLGAISRFSAKINRSINLDNTYFFFPKGRSTFTHKGQFSLISFKSNVVKLTGICEYKLTKWTRLRPLDSLGLSNVGHGKIEVESKHEILFYLRTYCKEKKQGE